MIRTATRTRLDKLETCAGERRLRALTVHFLRETGAPWTAAQCATVLAFDAALYNEERARLGLCIDQISAALIMAIAARMPGQVTPFAVARALCLALEEQQITPCAIGPEPPDFAPRIPP